MDPLGGAQPIMNEHGTASIVANGEIYNFPQLRDELAGRHRWRTSSDSESVLHLFAEHDLAAATKLRGMFAWAIMTDDRLVLARDPIGIKPLYLGSGPGAAGRPVLAFSSELTELCNWADEVKEFPPGHVYDSRTGFARYYTVPSPAPERLPVAEQLALVRHALEQSVASHMMSDVPVGAFLSGGLDSSVIAAIARRHVDELHTFSVGTAGSSDLRAARLVAEHIGSIHHEYVITLDDVRRELPDIVSHLESFDQDLVRSAIPTHFCARLASQHVKVILTGEGADELFAGYRFHHGFDDLDALHQELCRSVGTLHDINLQRADRLTMRHGVEGRVPFLDTDFIEMALRIPPDLKLPPAADRRTEKWVLRQACADLLPAEIVWRVKEQFDEGSGIADLVAASVQELLADAATRTGFDPVAYRSGVREFLRSDEETLYHHLLTHRLARPERLLANVARWIDDRVPSTT
jgi:asparagine synthase (glutamine-hydrolysing)